MTSENEIEIRILSKGVVRSLFLKSSSIVILYKYESVWRYSSAT